MSATTPPPAAALNDNDKKPPDEDSLGYDAYAKTLWTRIEQALNRDAVTGKRLGDDPLVVGIFGEWGAGKSFLLGRILKHAFAFEQGRIDLRKGGLTGGNAGFGLTVPVLFQPWKYEHEEHLHVPLLLHILEALKRDLSASKTIFERAKTGIDDGGDWLVRQMTPAVALFEKLVTGAAVATVPITLGGSLVAIPAMGIVKRLLSTLPSKKPDKPNLPATIRYTNEGRYFYEIHQHLKAVTRPATEANHAKGYTQGQQSKHEKLAINFVVFVDDLDRCLPEKAVAVLELIKTVFNVESFAFVLALDDEVIERGIGHRYKDYSFGNKKSEMPITGFEYLEKIVHLPFRLPALTREDALLFIKQKELKLLESVTPEQRVAYESRPWLSGFQVSRPAATSAEPDHVLSLSHMLVNSFDAYVPRKLDRAVELFHHVAKVAAERGRPLGFAAGAADIRIVFALVLIQLFQPELFRCLRRTGTAFDQLRDAFKDGYLSSRASDYELMDWACYGPERRAHQAAIRNLKDKIQTAATGIPPEQTEHGAQNHAAQIELAARLPTSLGATTEIIANLEASRRHSSQRVRLPTIERMIEHRGAQRHVFDVLKLFAALQSSNALMPLPDKSIQPYFGWLALHAATDMRDALPILEAVVPPVQPHEVGTETKIKPPPQTIGVEGIANVALGDLTSVAQDAPRVPLAEVLAVFSALTSFEPREQDQVVSFAGLKPGQIIDSRSAAELHTLTQRWLRESESSSSQGAFGAKGVLLRGLQYLAPHLAPGDAKAFWGLVSDSVKWPETSGELVNDPKNAALYADVRASLGQDDRFEPGFPFVMTKRFGDHKELDEPIAGFVRVPSGEFMMGDKEDSANPPHRQPIVDDFYIARTLTTVAQYARFVEAKGYEEGEAIWNPHGVEWLANNPERRAPDRWAEQLAHASHPVTDITWFEARAYAQWLSGQLRERLDKAKLHDYAVCLPTEPQWERAARALSLDEAHDKRWPWGDEAATAAQRANVDSTRLGGVSAVGLFAPNVIGLHDMAGNVWEWMDNPHESAQSQAFARVQPTDRYELVAKNDISLRGGSWLGVPEYASCFFRGAGLPSKSYDVIGVRVVLSLDRSAKRET